MQIISRSLALLTALALCTSMLRAQSAVADYDALLEGAIQAIDWQFDEHWAYTRTSVDDDRLWVARFDPSLPAADRWTVRSVDGRAPDEDEIDDYIDDIELVEFLTDGAVDIKDMTLPGRLTLIEETADHWLLSFRPNDDDEDFFDSVDGRIRIIKDGRYLESIELRNNSTIKPGLGTRIDVFLTRFTFAPINDDGPVVPRSIEVRVSGRALLFISFDETEFIAYSDFEFVGDGARTNVCRFDLYGKSTSVNSCTKISAALPSAGWNVVPSQVNATS